jgi:Spy/CpxP family protein refolding chaperone
MKRGWFLLLALSVGLNAGLLYASLFGGRGVQDVAAEPPPAFIEGAPPAPPVGAPPADAPPAAPCAVPCDERILRMARHLGLNEDQRSQMERILEESMPRIVAARSTVQEARRVVQAEYATESPDAARLHTAVRAMNAAQARLDSLVAETMMQEIGLLTPEQKRRYVERLPWAHCGSAQGMCPPGPAGEMERRHGR